MFVCHRSPVKLCMWGRILKPCQTVGVCYKCEMLCCSLAEQSVGFIYTLVMWASVGKMWLFNKIQQIHADGSLCFAENVTTSFLTKQKTLCTETKRWPFNCVSIRRRRKWQRDTGRSENKNAFIKIQERQQQIANKQQIRIQNRMFHKNGKRTHQPNLCVSVCVGVCTMLVWTENS